MFRKICNFAVTGKGPVLSIFPYPLRVLSISREGNQRYYTGNTQTV